MNFDFKSFRRFEIYFIIFFQDRQNLTEWEGWLFSKSKWESEGNVTPDLIRNYDAHHFVAHRANEAVLRNAIQQRLRGIGSAPINVAFPLDVFRNLLGKKTFQKPFMHTTKYTAAYFDSIPGLPPKWKYIFDKTGVGSLSAFPILMKPMQSETMHYMHTTMFWKLVRELVRECLLKQFSCTYAFKL